MPEDILSSRVIPHLGGQFERALPILFTGAGFSLDAKNIRGESLPTVGQLKNSLWGICFPGDPYDSSTSLQSLYEHANIRHSKALSELLRTSLSVAPESVPDWYATVLRMPWFRCYTLNIDDIEIATAGVHKLPRKLEIISATSDWKHIAGDGVNPPLQYIHLNGALADIPQNVTFSVTQYAERLVRPEPWYVRLNGEILSHSCVFIGTQLDETPFWQHLQLRKMRGSREMAELRPKSYLVTPSLDLPRQALLAEYNIVWLPMTGAEFTDKVLSHFSESARKGLSHIGEMSATTTVVTKTLSEVSKLAVNPHSPSNFLLGQEPIWADLQSGRAITRTCDGSFLENVRKHLSAGIPGVVVITGTAGSGKSTSLMRLCLRLTADGQHVGYINRETDLSPREIRQEMRKADGPSIIAIDDADIFGTELAPLVRDIALGTKVPLVLLGIRSGRVDRVLPPAVVADIPMEELVMPPLGDADIEVLLGVLDRENRLGLLKGQNGEAQRAAFREVATLLSWTVGSATV